MKKIFYLIIFLFIISSCKNQSESVKVPISFNKELVLRQKKDLTKLLPKEKIAEILNLNSEEIKTYTENLDRNFSKHTVLYSWANGEKKSIKTTKGKTIELEANSSLGIGFLKEISKQDFQKQFESKEFIQNEINRISEDETIDADLAIAEAKYLAENAKNQSFEKWENVGEISFWETPVNALHVFANGMSFTVTTNFETERESKEKAIQIAQLIFDNYSN